MLDAYQSINDEDSIAVRLCCSREPIDLLCLLSTVSDNVKQFESGDQTMTSPGQRYLGPIHWYLLSRDVQLNLPVAACLGCGQMAQGQPKMQELGRVGQP